MTLSRAQIEAFGENGIAYPIRGLAPDAARAFVAAQSELDARLRGGWDLPQYPQGSSLGFPRPVDTMRPTDWPSPRGVT